MNKIFALLAGLCIFTSCSENKTEPTASNGDATIAVTTTPPEEKKAMPAFLNSIRYKDWEIGDPENIKPVINFYRSWDNKETQTLASLFTDTIAVRIPDEKEEMIVPNNQIYQRLGRNLDMYQSSSNEIISAVSLHDRERNEDWVVTNVYAKWIEKDGKRDSLLYSDNWLIKNGKIASLLSFDKKATSTFLKRNDQKK